MQFPVKDRVHKLRQEISDLADANRRYVNSADKRPAAAAEQERRIQRLQEIMEELRTLTDWKET